MSSSDEAYREVSAIGDRLVTLSITSSEAFWTASREEQLLYGLCCILHHAGANGLTAVLEYDETNGIAVLAAAIAGLAETGDTVFLPLAQEYWEIKMEPARAAGVYVPLIFSAADRSAFHGLTVFFRDFGYDPDAPYERELDRIGEMFVSCWDSDLPVHVLDWTRRNRQGFSKLLTV